VRAEYTKVKAQLESEVKSKTKRPKKASKK
jgi:hypothetical protein